MGAGAVGWILVFHMIGMVMWIGGLFMALAAVRAGTAPLAQQSLRRFAHPGAALMIVTGGLLMWLLPGVREAMWLHVKLLLVLFLIVVDLLLAAQVRRMPDLLPSRGKLGMYHGAVGLIFLGILIMVLVRPF